MRCYKCMEEISNSQICPYCGYDIFTEPENKQYLIPGTKLGGIYTVGTVIGAGGFGVTYIGWDESLNRKVAIKEYFPSSLSTRIPGQTAISAFSGEKQQIFNHGKERFIEEARLLMQFTGEEGIVSVYNVLEANGTVYMVMEYVEGITLKQNIEQFGTIPEQQLLGFIVPMLLSLKYVHNAGFTHRDISPDNIMCQPDGNVKLLDFGAARYSVMEESKSLSVIVKQGFTPIEQYQSHGKQGPWTDLYAVGATMYKALTGITPDESLERMAKETLKKPSQCGAEVSENTENAIMAALNIRAEHRPQDVDEFLAILTGEQKGGLIGGKRPKKGIIVAVAAALAVALGGGALLWSFLRPDKEIPPDPQQIEVPDVINKLKPEAEEIIVENQLNMVVTGGMLYDAEMIEQGYVAENLVVVQEPTAGESVDLESTVGVVLSKGKEKEYIPSVIDRLIEPAIHEFERNGFGDTFEIELKEEYSDTNMAGTVISQSLPEDTAVDFDGKITLTISLGRKDLLASITTVTVDDYTGKDFDTLKQELLKDNIYLVKSASVYSNEYPYGAIISQSPENGSEIQSGGAVYVITSLGYEMARVPDVRYLTLDEAKTALMESGLSWKIKYVVDPEVSYGLVTEQKTAPGIKTPFGTEIELLVSAETEGSESKNSAAIEIAPAVFELSANETESLICSYTGDGDIIWAISNPYIAEVDNNGVVTAKNFGSTTISAAVDGNIATSMVTVIDESIITEVDDYVLVIGETVSLASAVPESILDDVVWRSSYPTVAAVDEKGTVTAVGEGYTSISATYKERTTECGIIVNKKVEYIKILKDVLLSNLETAKQALKSNNIEYEVVDEYHDTIVQGNVTKIKYSGHSDNDSFYIAEESKVTLLHSLGKNTVQSITVKTLPQKTTYLIGEKPDYKGLVITAKYKDGTTKDVSKGYSASSAALETLGTQKVTITYEKQSTTIDFKVNPIEVSSVSVNPETLTLIAGETKKLSAGIAPSNATDKKVSVSSSDSSVVKAEGLTLTALNAGTAKITVKANNGKSAVCTVTVVLPEVSSVSLSSSEMYLTAGESRKLTATVLPQNAGNKAVTWTSSNTNVASVDSSGNVTAIATGNAVITVKTGNGKTSSCTVYVSVPVTGVTIPSQIAMRFGETQQLKATVSPVNASDQTLTWISSNAKAATVDTSGKVTAIASGTAVITVQTNNGKTAACTVTVTTPLESISLPEDEFTGQVGKTYSITPTFVPSNADDRSFTVKVSDSTVLSVKDNKFTALKAGTATLTVTTPNGKSDSCKVTILGEAELTLIKKPSKTTYYIGDSLDTSGLKLGYTDTAGNYIELTKGFTISGGDTSSSGTQTVKVKYNDLSVKFDITVKTPSITINKLPIEGTVLLAVQTEPEDQKFDIWSSDPDVFVVASYLGASYIAQPTGEGTAEACVSMEYNGIEYTDYVSITSIAQNYDFELWADDCGDGEWVCGIETNIPGFDIRNVKWSTNAAEHWTDDNGYFRVWSKETIYVTASYVHNGKEYSDNCTIKIEVREYSFQIVRSTNSTPGERGIYYITTDIPDFDAGNVEWSIVADGWGGWVEEDYYVVDECSMEPGDSYIVYATYTYQGATGTSSFTFSLRS